MLVVDKMMSSNLNHFCSIELKFFHADTFNECSFILFSAVHSPNIAPTPCEYLLL